MVFCVSPVTLQYHCHQDGRYSGTPVLTYWVRPWSVTMVVIFVMDHQSVMATITTCFSQTGYSPYVKHVITSSNAGRCQATTSLKLRHSVNLFAKRSNLLFV